MLHRVRPLHSTVIGHERSFEVVVQFLRPGSTRPLLNDRFAARKSRVTLPGSGEHLPLGQGIQPVARAADLPPEAAGRPTSGARAVLIMLNCTIAISYAKQRQQAR
ncbi:protein of unknown function [Paraburkholderia kururiensis]